MAPTEIDFDRLSVASIAKAIRLGEVAAERLVDDLISRCIENDALNAFVLVDADGAREAARAVDIARQRGVVLGSLAGVPISLKDNIAVRGQEARAGTPALAGIPASADAEIVRSLREAGAIILGRTGMHELAFGVTNNNRFSGAVRNPYDQTMIPGGSSGGAAVSVAAGLVAGAIGTDTGGSVRIPAALCGVSGFRPSHGRWPRTGIVPIARSRDTAGPIARTVGDLALLDAVVTGDEASQPHPGLIGVRFGLPRQCWQDVDAEMDPPLSQALEKLVEAGAELVEIDLNAVTQLALGVGAAIIEFEPRRDLTAYLEWLGASITFEDLVRNVASPDVREIMEAYVHMPDCREPEPYRLALDRLRPALLTAYRDRFRDHAVTALLFPTSPLAARPIGDDREVQLNGRRVPTFLTYIRNTEPGSVAGLPGVSIPAGRTAGGAPVGIALDGLPGDDRALLALAAAVEAVCGARTEGCDATPR